MSCELCRKKHIKCDDQHPRCGQCLKAGRPCVRKSKSSGRDSRSSRFEVGQIWNSVPPKVEFVDETAQFTDINGTSPASGKDAATDGALMENQSSSRNLIKQRPLSLSTEESLRQSPPASPSRPLPARYSYSAFSTKASADLMRYFIDKCACFFDFGDADRHFAYHIPLRARQNETLANAMLALAARHRSRTPDVDLYVADRYYHTCLQSLIPRLGDPTATKDDELLAAIVILRLLEEMDVPIVGKDLQKHLFGTQAIINASQAQSAQQRTRQRTRMSCMNRLRKSGSEDWMKTRE